MLSRQLKNLFLAFAIVFALGPATFLVLYTNFSAQGELDPALSLGSAVLSGGANVVGLSGFAATQAAIEQGSQAVGATATVGNPTPLIVDDPGTHIIQEKDAWVKIALTGLENAAYGFLKGLARQVAIETAQSAIRTIVVGSGGKEPLFYSKPWDQYLSDAALDATGFFFEGLVQGFDDVGQIQQLQKDQLLPDKLKTQKSQLEANKKSYDSIFDFNIPESDLTDPQKQKRAEYKRLLENGQRISNELSNPANPTQSYTYYVKANNCYPNDPDVWNKKTETQKNDCNAFIAEEKQAIQDLNENNIKLKSITDQSDDFKRQIGEIDTQIPTAEKRASSAKEIYDQLPKEAMDRRLKYQQGDKEGGFSVAAQKIINNACAPNQLFSLQLAIGLGISQTKELRPTCTIKQAWENWGEAFQSSTYYNMSMRDLLNKQVNGWQTARSMINPFAETDLSVAFKLNLISEEEKVDKSFAAELTRKENQPFKAIQTLGGIIKTPGELVRLQTEQSLTKALTYDDRLYNKWQVDLADVASTFFGTLASRVSEIFMSGILDADTNDLASNSNLGYAFSGGRLVYAPDSIPSYNPQLLEARLTRLADLQVTQSGVQNTLTDLQSTNLGVQSRVINRAFAQAITAHMTVQEAIQKFKDTNGGVGISENAIFGFNKDKNEPNYQEGGLPYRSLVILRKYRVLPVSWELAALYIQKNPKVCSEDGCTLKNLITAFDTPTSPFYRLIDPNWVLKLPVTTCELEGYGPAILGERLQNDCTEDTNNNKVLCCSALCIQNPAFRDAKFNSKDSSTTPPTDYHLLRTLYEIQIAVDGEKKPLCADQTFGSAIQNMDPKLYDYLVDQDYKNKGIAGHKEVPYTPLTDLFSETCNNVFYKKDSGLVDMPITTQRRSKMCLDERSCIREDKDGKCVSDQAYGYCLEERKRFQFEGTQCSEQANSCDTFIDRTTKEKDFYLKNKLPQDNLTNDTSGNPTINLCRAENAGCAWYSSERTNAQTADAQTSPASGATLAVYKNSEWDETKKVYLNAQAPICNEDNEGCTGLKFIDAKGVLQNRFIRVAPSYYACGATPDANGKPAYKKTECKNFALYCKQEDVGCDRYESVKGDPVVAAPTSSLQMCEKQCVGLTSFIKTATEFEPQAPTGNDTILFIPSQARMCSSTDVGCDEFTNLDEKARGGEGLEYYSHLQACEKLPDTPTVFYTFYGSDTSGYKPEKVFLKPDNGNPACADGSTSCVCNESDFNSQKNTPNAPEFRCREFINAQGTKSYRYWDKIVYQTQDCHPYRRTLDGPNGQTYYITKQFGLSKQCSASSNGCREYKSPRAGNVWAQFYDNFENEENTTWSAKLNSDLITLSNSQEAETLDNHSLLLSVNQGVTADKMEIKRSVAIDQGYSYKLVLGIKGGVKNKLTATLAQEDSPGSFSSMVELGNIQELSGNWQHVTFFLPQSSFTAPSQTGRLILTIEKNTGTSLGGVLLDDIALKKVQGVVYAIQSSISTDKAFPSVCSASISTQLNCQEYRPSHGSSVYFSAVGRLCPTEMVGCQQFAKADGAPLYLVDDREKWCPQSEQYCTAYGKPHTAPLTNGDEKVLYKAQPSTRVVTTAGNAEIKPVTEQKILWDVKHYKITPDQITANETTLKSTGTTPEAQAAKNNAYKAGSCLAQENGCRAYDTTFEHIPYYFKNSGKIKCYYDEASTSANSSSVLKWKYKTCSHVPSGDSFSCTGDEDCRNMYGQDSQCNVEADCLDPEATPKPTQNDLNKILYSCVEKDSSCRKITDPECIQVRRCTDSSVRCDNQGGNDTERNSFCGSSASGTNNPNSTCADFAVEDTITRTNYGRDQVNAPEVTCKKDYYYLANLSEEAQQKKDTLHQCLNTIDVEKGCLAFHDTNKGSNTFDSAGCYQKYYEAQGVGRNPQATPNCVATKDSNTILRVKQDRECKTWLSCYSYETVQVGGKNKIVCSSRIPCSKATGNETSSSYTADSCANDGMVWTPGDPKDAVPSLSHVFQTPFTQLLKPDQTIDTSKPVTDYTFANLSGISRPDFVFGSVKDRYPQFNTNEGPFAGHDGYFSWNETSVNPQGASDPDGTSVLQKVRDATYGSPAQTDTIVLACKIYPGEFAPMFRAAKETNQCVMNQFDGGATTQTRGRHGYCLEPYPDFEGNGFVNAYKDNATRLSPAPGINQPYGYTNYCLNWYPTDFTRGEAPQGNTSPLTAFDRENAYYCTKKDPAPGYDIQVGTQQYLVAKKIPARSTPVTSNNFTVFDRFAVVPLLKVAAEKVLLSAVPVAAGLTVAQGGVGGLLVLVGGTYMILTADLNDALQFKETGNTISSTFNRPNVHQTLYDNKKLFVYSEAKAGEGEPNDSRNDEHDIIREIPANDEEIKIDKSKIASIEYKIETSTRRDTEFKEYVGRWINGGKDFTFLALDEASKRNYWACPFGMKIPDVLGVPGCQHELHKINEDNAWNSGECSQSSGEMIDGARTFIAIKPIFSNGKLSAWKWRNCNKDASHVLEISFVSITIHTFEKIDHPIVRSISSTICQEATKISTNVAGDKIHAVPYLSKIKDNSNGNGFSQNVKIDGASGDTANTLAAGTDLQTDGTDNYPYYYELGDKDASTEIVGVPSNLNADQLSKLAQTSIVEKSGTSNTNIAYPALLIDEDMTVTKISKAETTRGAVKITLNGTRAAAPHEDDIVLLTHTDSSVITSPEKDRTFLSDDVLKGYFAKQYGKATWQGGSVAGKGHYAIGGSEIFTGTPLKQLNILSKDVTDPTNRTKDIPDRFNFEPLYGGKGVTLKFFVKAEQDQLPLRHIKIDWGDGILKDMRSDNGEGQGYKDVAPDNDGQFVSSIPGFGRRNTLNGRILCVEVMDNWGVKRVVCGKFVKDVVTGTVSVPKFCAASLYDTARKMDCP